MKKLTYYFFPVFILSLLNLFISGCSGKSDNEYLQIGNKDVTAKQYNEAAKSYQDLLDKHPDSKLAPEALFKLASLYHGNVLKGISHQESLKKAVKLYGEVYDKYPDSPRASTALFIKGFILANDLNDYAEAKEAYTLFLKKYPDNQLVPSVKEELNNLGVPPDEILKGKTAKPT
jgi:N-acetylmuramoyl-L-alanine amidase